jgi:hypothetical protein
MAYIVNFTGNLTTAQKNMSIDLIVVQKSVNIISNNGTAYIDLDIDLLAKLEMDSQELVDLLRNEINSRTSINAT